MLGIISNNPEINRTLRGPGILPNDLDLSRHRPYLPYHHGWIVGKNRTYWNGSLGLGLTPAEEMRIMEMTAAEFAQWKESRDRAKHDKMRAWATVIGTAASVGIAAMLLISMRRGS